MQNRRPGKTGGTIRRRVADVYDTVHSALWAVLIAGLIMFVVFDLPAVLKGDRVYETHRARALEAEDNFYCRRWGMAAGSGRHGLCMSDLAHLRAAVEKRAADDSGF
jgi:hypothetical protein